MRIRTLSTRTVVSVLLSTTIAAQGVFAQDATVGDQASEDESSAKAFGYGDEIVVTARRTEEDIQSVPVSVTAFNADTLRSATIRDTQDLLVKTPGIFLAGSGGRENTNFSIRGQSKALAGNSAPGVISYFAEVPAPTLGSSIPTYDLSSVQVLKGPQGTLFGRNTTGGAILYYPTAPNYDIGGYVTAAYGNYDARILEGALNIPVVADIAALRVAGSTRSVTGGRRTSASATMPTIRTRAHSARPSCSNLLTGSATLRFSITTATVPPAARRCSTTYWMDPTR